MRNFALVLFGFAIGLALAEGGLRAALAVFPDPPGSTYVRDAAAAYRLRPDAAGTFAAADADHINSFGFRDHEHRVEKPPGTCRIVGIGDSFVYGAVPLEENFLRVAAARLNAASADSTRVESALLGLGGYSTENEVGVLRTTGLALHPDLVVLCFFVGNDVTGIPVRGEVMFGRLYYVGSPEPWRNFLRHSRLYVLAETAYVTGIKSPLLARLHPGRAPVNPVILEARANALPVQMPAVNALPPSAPAESASTLLSPAVIAAPVPPLDGRYVDIESRNVPVYSRHPDAAMLRLWDEAERQILEFDRRCRAAAVPWVMLVIPEELQVDPQVRAALQHDLRLADADYDFELPQHRLHEFAGRHAIRVLDPLPELRAVQRPDARLYVPNNTHWNAAGNRVAGELLADWVRTSLRADTGCCRPDR